MNPNCQLCKGAGFKSVGPTPEKPFPSVQLCPCNQASLVADTLERGWKGLTSAPKLDTSPLVGKVNQDLWVTMPEDTMRQHLRHVAIRQGWRWFFKVASDSELVSAWLATAVRDKRVMDPDVRDMQEDIMTLIDLALPPQLLIVRTGIKSAPNKAMPDVLLEAILERRAEGKVTWLWDTLQQPLAEGHRCWSERVSAELRGWEHISLGEIQKPPPRYTETPIPDAVESFGTPKAKPVEHTKDPLQAPSSIKQTPEAADPPQKKSKFGPCDINKIVCTRDEMVNPHSKNKGRPKGKNTPKGGRGDSQDS